MDVSAQEIKYIPQLFTISIEMRKPLEIELAQRFLAELNELRGVCTSPLAEAFSSRCEEFQQEAA